MDQQIANSRITIGMPVYNGERYLEETLGTVLNQTYSDFTVIISDNASTDKTEEICQDISQKDSRINYIRNEVNLGASANYERCFKPARSIYFRWQNADDPIEPTLLENCIKILDENEDVVLAYGKTHIIDEHGQFIEVYDDNLNLPQDKASDRFLAFTNNIGLQNLMYGLIRREALAKTALLGNYLSADINLIGELSLHGKFIEVPLHLFNRRMHPECSTWDKNDDEKLTSFWDPSKRKLIMQTWRSVYEYYKAVMKAPIPFYEKRILAYYLLKRAYWRKKEMKNELVDLMKYSRLRQR